LLVVIIGVLGLRIVVYLLCSIAGFHIWILPNFLGEYGFLDSFKPFIEVVRIEKNKVNIALRLFVALIFILYAFQLYMDPTFFECNFSIILAHFTFTKNVITDVHDWGVTKIKN
jgi:hypothetical protein